MTASPVGGATEELLDELLLDELEDDLLLELDELLDEALLDELDLLLEALDGALELLVPLGTEHSLVPPATLVPAPKVTSPQTKLPLSVL